MKERKRDGSRWAERTIHKGQVRFGGKVYRVEPMEREPGMGRSDPPYDGRLDGLRALFHNYSPRFFPRLADYVYVHSFGDEWPGPNYIDGRWVWESWREVSSPSPRSSA